MTASQLIVELSKRIGILGCDFEVKIWPIESKIPYEQQEFVLIPWEKIDGIHYYNLTPKQN